MYEALDSAGGEIRLLLLEPAKTLEAPLVCHLSQVFLSSGPDYEALSYTWGTKGVAGTISLDGQPAEIYESLEAVLRRLRLPNQSRTLWIDAICINQDDREERQRQVTLMRKVFEQARRVCIWLGERSEGSKLGMVLLERKSHKELMSTFRAYVERDKMSRKQYRRYLRDLQMVIDGSGILSLTNTSEEQDYGEIRELLDRPWWSRAWVVQEAVLAKDIVVMCGPETTTWESIERTIDYIYVGTSWLAGGLEAVLLFGVPFGSTYKLPDENYRKISTMRKLWLSGDRDTSFFKMMFAFTSMDCTDPRDRIYSFLGFASSELRHSVKPDYSAPVPTVYENFARQAIDITKSLDILNCKREWLALRDQGSIVKPTYAYSVLDQGRYYDDFALVIDQPGGKPRRDWARLPPGWERIVTSRKTCYFYNHNDKTTSQTNPMDSQPPHLVEHFTKRRVCPPGWVKTWDNLGRARVAYAPHKEAKLRVEPPLRKELSTMPSWVPSWATHTDFDPGWLISTLAKDGRDHWFTANHDADIATGGKAMASHELALEGIFFDEIERMGTAWHPGDASPPISAVRMSVLTEWSSLAETSHVDVKSPYETYDLTITDALGRTLLADQLGEEMSAAEDGKLFQTWMQGSKWDTLENPHFETATTLEVIRTAIEFSGLEEVMVAYYSQVVCAADAVSAAESFDPGRDKFSYRVFATNVIRAARNEDLPESLLYEKYGKMILRIHECCSHRAFFVTKRGYFGLCPWNAQLGDRVYGLKGGKTPFLLRPEPSCGSDAFTLVGEAFVNDPVRGLPIHQDHQRAGWQSVRLI